MRYAAFVDADRRQNTAGADARWLNHSWHVALYVTARGLTTSHSLCERAFQIDFDFVDHVLWVRTSDGEFPPTPARPMPVAQFYTELFDAMAELGLEVRIATMPCEIADPHSLRSGPLARRLRSRLCRSLLARVALDARCARPFPNGLSRQGEPGPFLLGQLRPRGHALLRGPAPHHPGGVPHLPDAVAAEAYSHEVSSAASGRAGAASSLRSLLFLRLSGSAGFCPFPGAARRRLSFPKNWANSLPPSTPSAPRGTPSAR